MNLVSKSFIQIHVAEDISNESLATWQWKKAHCQSFHKILYSIGLYGLNGIVFEMDGQLYKSIGYSAITRGL